MKRDKIAKWSIFLVAALAIAAMMPRNGKFLTSFNIGEVWDQATITAPFDMPIYKSDAELNRDMQQAEKGFVPVYTVNNNVEIQALETLHNDYGTDSRYEEYDNALKNIYKKGVAGSLEKAASETTGKAEADNQQNVLKLIRINRDGVLEKVATDEVYSAELASQALKQDVADDIDWAKYISSNLNYDKNFNSKLKEAELTGISRTKGIIVQDEVIVSKDQVIDNEVFGKLNSLKVAYERSLGGEVKLSNSLGYFVLVVLLLALSYMFLVFFRREFVDKLRNTVFLLLIYVIMVALCVSVDKMTWISIYTVPLTIVPIYVMTFFDIRMSIFEFVITLLMCALVVSRPFEFIIVNFVAGVVGVFMLRSYYIRGKVFWAAASILATYVVTYISMQLIQGTSFSNIDYMTLIWFVINTILFLGLYQLTYVIERLFGFVSDITLLELCDTNHQLLLDLAHKAPGTFQHSLQVANLSEAAAKAVGANALLARTGALYHDVGKMNQAEYYIENNSSAFNPHNMITPIESATIIKSHVTDGLALAKKDSLPSVVTEFITSHHGDSLIFFFYSQQQKLTPDEVVESDFRYEGARPASKEATICMMCDAIEAASRSLKDYTPETISNLVDGIIDVQLKDKQYSDSLMSMSEIGVVKEVIKSKLSNVYHARIAYPERA